MYKKQSDIYKNHVASVLEFIYRAGQTSRIEIANNTGLTPALMTSITADLMEKGQIMETGDEISGISGSGRKRKLLTLNASSGYLLGIEINMRGIFIALTDLVGTVIQCSGQKLGHIGYAQQLLHVRTGEQGWFPGADIADRICIRCPLSLIHIFPRASS